MDDRRSNLDLGKNKCVGKNDEERDWSSLLPELLTLVLSRLKVKDNIRASAVCKAWYKSSVSIRMNDRHLWFMKYPLSSRNIRSCELYDPLQKITYLIEYPEIEGMLFYHAKDGWLLMHKGRLSELFFFNPFSRKLIRLPNCESYNECAVFTCAPTSDNCLVFGLTNINNNDKIVGINTLKLGETKWKTTYFMMRERFFAYCNRVVFSGGLFYCLGGSGTLAVFNPFKQTLNIHRPKYDGGFIPSPITWIGTYLVEIKEDIFLLKTSSEKPRLFRLNRDEAWIWKESDRIDERLTIFGASCVSECRSDLPNHMINRLFLSDSHHPMVKTYLLDEGRYLLNDSCNPFWNRKTIFQSIWIEAPKQFLNFI